MLERVPGHPAGYKAIWKGGDRSDKLASGLSTSAALKFNPSVPFKAFTSTPALSHYLLITVRWDNQFGILCSNS